MGLRSTNAGFLDPSIPGFLNSWILRSNRIPFDRIRPILDFWIQGSMAPSIPGFRDSRIPELLNSWSLGSFDRLGSSMIESDRIRPILDSWSHRFLDPSIPGFLDFRIHGFLNSWIPCHHSPNILQFYGEDNDAANS